MEKYQDKALQLFSKGYEELNEQQQRRVRRELKTKTIKEEIAELEVKVNRLVELDRKISG